MLQGHPSNEALRVEGVKKQSSLRDWIRILNENPSILLAPLLLWVLLMAAGLGVAFTLNNASHSSDLKEAQVLAEDTGQYFSQMLDQALLPVFSLAQFVPQVEPFEVLAQSIGPTETNGRSPFQEGSTTHRNVTGVCDDPTTLQKFNGIAAGIKRNAKMEGVLVNLQLAPQAVVCLVHPLNNTEDFPPGKFLDNSGAVGHDLLFDPKRRFIAEQTVPSEGLVIAGPLKMTSCVNKCEPLVSEAMIARLPIYSASDIITVDGKPYPRWGFAVAIINWHAAVQKSGIYQTFKEAGKDFVLTRTDRIVTNGETTEEIKILAKTEHFDKRVALGHFRVSSALETTNNEWVMTIVYKADKKSAAFTWTIITTIIFSSLISFMVFVVLIQKQIHSEVQAEQTALLVNNARQAALAERELNEFIAHEVRNPLSAALSACTFVKTAIWEKEPMVTPRDQKAVRDDIDIVENSLRFINDLLRSMLDIHKAQDKQMKLHLDVIDIKQDILQPVEAMLYRRDENFEVIVECEPSQILVETDRLRLQQIVLNLSRNAAKFVEGGYIRLRSCVENEEVRIYVEDSGPGVPEEKRKNLFCRFQESLDSMAQGTGVGLNLCKSLIDLMEGDIWLDESFHSGLEGKPGTRIVINLRKPPVPIEKSESTPFGLRSVTTAKEASAEDDEFVFPEKLNVLFVDDDRILRKLGVRTLNNVLPSWTVKEAASGETALQMTDTEHFDFIFMDQYMTSVEQALKGSETVRALRAKGVTQSIICGLSANNIEDTFREAGADGFILKPFPCKQDQLRKTLIELLSLNNRRALRKLSSQHTQPETHVQSKGLESSESTAKSSSGDSYHTSNNDNLV